MPQSFASVYLHIVFSTLGRRPFLSETDVRSQMHAYLGGLTNELGCQNLCVGGVEDHVHILVRYSRTITIADLVKKTKNNSSNWVKTMVPGFAWQSGYAAFSFAGTDLEEVRNYVRNQEEHHRKLSFQDEFLNLLREHGLAWDERYIWD